MENEEFIEVTFGSYKLSNGSYTPLDGEKIECICIESQCFGEQVIFLNRTEAQQFIANLYKEINKLS